MTAGPDAATTASDGPSVCVVVPAYNEARRLDVDAFVDHLETHPNHSLVLVDDASTDSTGDVLARIEAHHPSRVRVIAQPANGGKAAAVRTGVAAALDAPRAELIAYWDADLATPLSAMNRLASRFSDPDVDFVLGSRVRMLGRSIVRRPFRHYTGRVFATGASLALGLPVYDTQCGAKMFRSDSPVAQAFDEPFTSAWAFDVEVIARYLVAARRAGRDGTLRIVEEPLMEWRDVDGSNVKPIGAAQAFADLARIGRWLRRHS